MNWKCIVEFTRVKNRSPVQNVTWNSHKVAPWSRIPDVTLTASRSSVLTVTRRLSEEAKWTCIEENTPGKSRSPVLFVTSVSIKILNWLRIVEFTISNTQLLLSKIVMTRTLQASFSGPPEEKQRRQRPLFCRWSPALPPEEHRRRRVGILPSASHRRSAGCFASESRVAACRWISARAGRPS